LVKYVEKYSDTIFHFLSIGLNYFEKYFGVPYQFSKLDLIFCPDYLHKAMENVGAITFSEKYFMFYNKSTFEDTSQFMFMIFFELAHMWIGNLVTLDWWNELWLNEGIARFLSILVIESHQELNYFMGWSLQTKNNQRHAFKADQGPSSHSIEGTCRDTMDIHSFLDSITFDKSSSIICQLYQIIGSDNFRKWLIKCIKDFEFGNADSKEMIGILNSIIQEDKSLTDFNINEWADQWVKTSGLSVLTPIWECNDGAIRSFKIQQNASKNSMILRNHKIDICFFYFDQPTLKEENKDIWVARQECTDIKSLIGKKSPNAVLLNSNGGTYASIYLDEQSFKSLMSNIDKIDNRLLHTQVLYCMYSMAILKYNPFEFFDFLCKECFNFKWEQSSIPDAICYIKNLCSKIFPDSCFAEYSKKANDTLYKLFMSPFKPKVLYDVRTFALKALIELANTKEDILKINSLVKFSSSGDKKKVYVIPLKLMHKYYIKLCSIRGIDIDGMESIEYVRDIIENSEEGEETLKLKESCEAALPDLEKKMALLNGYISGTKVGTYDMLEASMVAFRQPSQMEIMREVDKQIFVSLAEIGKMERRRACMFLTHIFPRTYESNELWHLSNLEKYVHDKVVLGQIKLLSHKIGSNKLAKEKSAKLLK